LTSTEDNYGEAKIRTDRLLDIDRAKGFAIALVVWGHLASATLGSSPLWFLISISTIYSFHMPLFMYFSGFVFFYVNGPDRFLNAPLRQALSRSNRLLVPFLVFGFLVVLGKYAASNLGGVVDPVGSLSEGLSKVVRNTQDNPSASIWYLLVLFIYTIITPVVWKIGKRRISVILLIGFVGWLSQLPEEFYLNRIASYYIFFGVGALCAVNAKIILPIFSRLNLIFMVIFIFIVIHYFDKPLGLLLCGLASIPAIHGLFRQRLWQGDSIFLTLGRYSMAIYLLNTIFLGVAKLAALRLTADYHLPFTVYIVTLFTIGLCGPIAVRRALGYFPHLRPVTRYLD
jgi:fucose 4-O-acetylase-like acetyltransferase